MIHEKLKEYHKYANYIQTAFHVDCLIFETFNQQVVFNENTFCSECHLNKTGKCDAKNLYNYGSHEAARWSGKYIFYCPSGYIFIASSLDANEFYEKDALITGPIFMAAKESKELDAENVVRMTPAEVGATSEIIASICGNITHENQAGFIREEQQKNMHNVLYSFTEEEKTDYPIENESQLQKYISSGDKSRSQEMLNNLLGAIYFSSNGDFNVIKARAIELVVLLSRASIQGGAKVDEVFWLNNEYIKQLSGITRLDELNVWLSEIMHRFISYVFDFESVKHTDVIYKTVEYIKANLTRKITLNEIADYVFLSKSYLSRIFKQEMNCSLTTYINQLRVERAKELLLDNQVNIVDIAFMVGFEDQSYFTKVFGQICGVSPGKYRVRRGRI